MAKSIRSKSKRKNRTEFRNTIGSEAAKATMAIVQEKLQQCVNSGHLNSFDRISNLFSGSASNNPTPTDGDKNEDDEMMIDSAGNESLRTAKEESKIPTKKAKSKSTKHNIGQYGDKTSRKVGERKSRKDRTSGGGEGGSKGRSLESRRQRSSSKKRSGKKLAIII